MHVLQCLDKLTFTVRSNGDTELAIEDTELAIEKCVVSHCLAHFEKISKKLGF